MSNWRVSPLVTLRLLIRWVIAYRVAYSLWIRCPAYLLSLYTVAKAIHYRQLGPLSSKTCQDSLATGRTVGQDTVQVPCVGTSALEQSVTACITWDCILHPSPVPACTRPVLPSTLGLNSDPSTVPCIWGHAVNSLYKLSLQSHCWFCLYGDSSQPLWPMNGKSFSLFTIQTLTSCAALDLNNWGSSW